LKKEEVRKVFWKKFFTILYYSLKYYLLSFGVLFHFMKYFSFLILLFTFTFSLSFSFLFSFFFALSHSHSFELSFTLALMSYVPKFTASTKIYNACNENYRFLAHNHGFLLSRAILLFHTVLFIRSLAFFGALSRFFTHLLSHAVLHYIVLTLS